jgi:hypothetical protein
MRSENLLIIAAGISIALSLQAAQAGPCMNEIGKLEKTLASKDAGMGPTDSGMPKEGVVPGTDATQTMNEAVQGKAASPEDVQKQNQGQPTAAEAAKAGASTPAAGTSNALNSLQQAKELDKAGKEAECMSAIQDAKKQMGSQ